MVGSKGKTVAVHGVPSDLGANIRGANMGPAAIRIADLKSKIEALGHRVVDHGDVTVPVREAVSPEDQDRRFLGAITALCGELCKQVDGSFAAGQLPLTLGGDHSIAVGSISGMARRLGESNQQLGVIWVDAHADINTPETSESGNIHGMPLSALLGNGHPELTGMSGLPAALKAENVVLVGIRTIDEIEKQVLRQSGVRCFTMRDIDQQGMFAVMQEAIGIAGQGTAGIHLSFDIDAIDPHFAPGVSTPVAGGLSLREAHLLLELIAESEKLLSMDFVELNPFTDHGAVSAHLVVDLVLSALGKSIV